MFNTIEINNILCYEMKISLSFLSATSASLRAKKISGRGYESAENQILHI